MTQFYISQSPLPDAETVIQESTEMAWAQVLAWSAAATGILLTVMLIKAFTK